MSLPLAMQEAPTRSDGLVDRFGRTATDLRVSLTDRCNLRCVYCMPAEGLEWIPREETLTDDEVARLIRVAVEHLGIKSVRFTGGEPLIRPGLAGIIRKVAQLPAAPELALTTNGIGLAAIASELREAGLHRINVSLDTLIADRFRRLTRRDGLDEVLQGLAAAELTGLRPVKVNSVLMREINGSEAADLLRFSLENGYEHRFIEQMPLDPMHSWSRADMVSAAEILDQLRKDFELTPDPAVRGSAPAERWLVDGGPATVGVIASVSRPFCRTCDRARLTADGQIRTCLFARTESDIRSALRAGASDAELADLWRTAAAGKSAGHGVDGPDFIQPDRAMSAIGG